MVDRCSSLRSIIALYEHLFIVLDFVVVAVVVITEEKVAISEQGSGIPPKARRGRVGCRRDEQEEENEGQFLIYLFIYLLIYLFNEHFTVD